MSRPIEIKGGAGPYETAAIMAAVEQLLLDEAASASVIPSRHIPSEWVRSQKTRVVPVSRQPYTALTTRAVDEAIPS